jgi:hypothetical protein
MMPAPSLEKPATVKKISWNGAAWVCDNFEVRVWRCLGDKRELADTDSNNIQIQLTSDPDWLAMGTPVKKVDTWSVPVGIKQGVTVAPGLGPMFSPEGTSALRDRPEYHVTDNFNVAPEPPQTVLSVSATVTVKIKIDSPVDAALAAAGMFPGTAVFSAGIPPVTLTSPLRYEVTPPTFQWTASQNQPVRLNGKSSGLAGKSSVFPDEGVPMVSDSSVLLNEKTGDDVRLVLDTLPPGWNQLLRVDAGIAEKSRKLAVRATALQPAPQAPPGSLEAQLHVESERLVIFKESEIDPAATPDPNANIELFIVTRSPWLGTIVQRGLLADALALETAIYFSNLPLASHKFLPADFYSFNDLNSVGVIPKDLVSKPPDLCSLAVRLDYLPHWDEPPLHWYTGDEFDNIYDCPVPTGRTPVLDDKFACANARQTVYQAPTLDAWTGANQPDQRAIVCLVGSGKDKEEVPDHAGLYFTAPLGTDLDLINRVHKVRLRIKLRPTDFVDGDQTAGLAGNVRGTVQLDLKNPSIRDALVRDFYLNMEFL